jgi:cell division inhibitor SepF
MSDLWRKTLVYLGLVEEAEEHEEPDPRTGSEEAEPSRPRTSRAPSRRERAAPREATSPATRRVRPLRAADEQAEEAPAPRDTHVRAVPDGPVRVAIIRPSDFEEAERVGERYRAGQPVLLDLGQVDNTVGRRLLDFVAGTIFALRGQIRPAGARSFLLVPEGVEVGFDERKRLADLGYQVGGRAEESV